MAAADFGVVFLFVFVPAALRAAPADRQVTFSKDVAPIFQDK